MWQRDARDRTILQSTPAAAVDVRYTLIHFCSSIYILYWLEIRCYLCEIGVGSVDIFFYFSFCKRHCKLLRVNSILT